MCVCAPQTTDSDDSFLGKHRVSGGTLSYYHVIDISSAGGGGRRWGTQDMECKYWQAILFGGRQGNKVTLENWFKEHSAQRAPWTPRAQISRTHNGFCTLHQNVGTIETNKQINKYHSYICTALKVQQKFNFKKFQVENFHALTEKWRTIEKWKKEVDGKEIKWNSLLHHLPHPPNVLAKQPKVCSQPV